MNILPRGPERRVLISLLVLLFNSHTMQAQQPLSVRVMPVQVSPEGESTQSFTFSVTNQSRKKIRFCTYMTPFEGFYGDYLEIRDAEGAKIPYQGVKVKRGKPGKEDHIRLGKGETISVNFSLKENYSLNGSGPFQLQFKGSPYLNELPDSELVEFEASL